MQVKAVLAEIPKIANCTTEYIESELKKQNLNPLRWAIVNVSDTMYTVSAANLEGE